MDEFDPVEEARPSPAAPAPERPPGAARMIWELIKINVVVVVLVVTMRAFVVEAYVVHGASMEPTFEHSQRLLITKFAPHIDHLERFDIVIFEHPEEPGKRLIKRIIALPGEAIEIRSGAVLVDGEPLVEPYVVGVDGTWFDRHIIPPGCYFVLGDNRAVSNDSRRIGDVRVESIIGRAIVRFYPWGSLKFF